jgi:hypothetical protein
MFNKLKYNSNTTKKIAILIVLILVVLLAVSIYLRSTTNVVKVEILSGNASIRSSAAFVAIESDKLYSYYSGNTLSINPNSSVLLYFPSGKTLALNKETNIEMIVTTNSDGEKIFLFENKASKEAFSFNDSTGIHRVTAAVLGGQNNINSKILGISEDKSE